MHKMCYFLLRNCKNRPALGDPPLRLPPTPNLRWRIPGYASEVVYKPDYLIIPYDINIACWDHRVQTIM